MSVDTSNLFLSVLKERTPLTKAGSSKCTYHVCLDLEGSNLSFAAGDSIALYPQNDPTFVQRMLDALQASGEEEILEVRSQTRMSLRHLLLHKADLFRLSLPFFRLLCEHSSSRVSSARLLAPENRASLLSHLATCDPLTLLEEHGRASVPLQLLCEQFRPLLPRFYSVASSLRASPGMVDLVVALFTQTDAGRVRYGVASHFLCHLAEIDATRIPMYVQPAHNFSLPADPTTALIMIGPGAGVAPFRAFLQERLHTGATGKHWLFFGERNRAHDYFYEAFWEELVARDKLRLSLAFSRDQPQRRYVQHCMLEQAKELWAWLQEGACIYVCGDAKQMAKDVERTWQQIAQEQGGMDEAQARAYLRLLRTQKRYKMDVY